MNKDLISGVVLLAIAAAYYVAIGDIADSTLSDEVGAAGLPRILAVMLTLLALILTVRGVLAMRHRTVAASGDDGDDSDYVAPPLRAIGFLLFGVAYVLVVPFVGYIVATALLIAAIAIYEGSARSWVVPVTALFGAILYWAIFVQLLGTRQILPGSLFTGLF